MINSIINNIEEVNLEYKIFFMRKDSLGIYFDLFPYFNRERIGEVLSEAKELNKSMERAYKILEPHLDNNKDVTKMKETDEWVTYSRSLLNFLMFSIESELFIKNALFKYTQSTEATILNIGKRYAFITNQMIFYPEDSELTTEFKKWVLELSHKDKEELKVICQNIKNAKTINKLKELLEKLMKKLVVDPNPKKMEWVSGSVISKNIKDFLDFRNAVMHPNDSLLKMMKTNLFFKIGPKAKKTFTKEIFIILKKYNINNNNQDLFQSVMDYFDLIKKR